MTIEAENARLRQENSQLSAANEALQARVAELEQALAELLAKGKGQPSFVKANKRQEQEPASRRKRAAKHNQARRREVPTRVESHRLSACPGCGGELSGHKVRYRRQIIDIPEPQPVEVVEHQIEAGWCARCRQWHRPAVAWPTAVGQGRIGVRLRGLVGYMHSVLRLPYRQIQAFLQTVHRVRLSVGQLVQLNQKIGHTLAEEISTIRQEAQQRATVHMDETGWRENGQNGYIWCLVTDGPQAVRYFEYQHSRAGPVVTNLLGDAFGGVLVSDFYGAYNVYTGRHQRCWVHLLRDLAQLREAQATDGAIVAWCIGVKNLYYLARDLARDPALDEAARQARIERLVEMTRQFGLLYAQADHPCRALAKRLLRHMDELFLFVLYPDLSADNNLAERALRPLVIQRKVCGGSRSPNGSQATMRLATLFHTWLARDLNPLLECWRLFGYQPTWAISS